MSGELRKLKPDIYSQFESAEVVIAFLVYVIECQNTYSPVNLTTGNPAGKDFRDLFGIFPQHLNEIARKRKWIDTTSSMIQIAEECLNITTNRKLVVNRNRPLHGIKTTDQIINLMVRNALMYPTYSRLNSQKEEEKFKQLFGFSINTLESRLDYYAEEGITVGKILQEVDTKVKHVLSQEIVLSVEDWENNSL